MLKIALNAGNVQHGSSLFLRTLSSLCLFAGTGLLALTARAADEPPANAATPSPTTAPVATTAPAANAVPAEPSSVNPMPSPSPATENAPVSPPIGASTVEAVGPGPAPTAASTIEAVRPDPAAKPTAKTGAPAESGLPGWMAAPNPSASGLEWHGNLELDGGYVRYSWNQESQRPEKVYDSRGRFVVGPVLTHDLGNDHFLRVTGQVVAWVREDYDLVQVSADDVYVQIGKKGRWDFMAGRFLTWRVFRKGLGFDLYTLEDTGARTEPNFAAATGWYPHMYEVNTIFMRDSFGSTPVPAGRAAFHYYPTAWSGLELVGSYGRLQSGGNVAGGRIAAGIQQKYFNVLGGAEYEHWSPPQQIGGPDANGSFVACDKCGVSKTYGGGGSAALTLNPFELVFDAAYRKFEKWDAQVTSVHTNTKTVSLGGYLQFDAGSVLIDRSLIVGVGLFRTELLDNDQLFQRHVQAAGYVAYPLGFNNAIVKLVLSKATGHQTQRETPVLDSDMYSLRLRFGFYY